MRLAVMLDWMISQIVYKLGQVHRTQFERNLCRLRYGSYRAISLMSESRCWLAVAVFFRVVEHLLTVVDMGGRRGKSR